MALLAALAPAAQAGQPGQAQRDPHIGYVYPAGGRLGETFQVTVGGQFLDGVSDVRVSGAGVTAKVVEYIKPMSGQEATQLRDKLKELQEKRAAALGLPMPNPAAPPKAPPKAPAADAAAPDKAAPAPEKAVPVSDKAAPAPDKAAAAPAEAPVPAAPAVKPTWTPEDAAALAEVREKLAKFVRKPTSPAIAETVTLQVTVAKDAEVGHHDLRLEAPAGLTNPLVFCVGQLPEATAPVIKHAPEATKSAAKREMTVTLPVTVNGQIMAGGVDRYKFQARRGQRLVVIAAARELMPYLPDAVPGWFQAVLTLYDAKGHELAYDEDFRFNPDPVMYFQIPQDGEYAIEIRDSIYRGREDFVYRVSLGELPFVINTFPLGGPAGAATTVNLTGWNLPATKVTMDAKDKAPGVYPLSERRSDEAVHRVPFAVDALPEVLDKEPNDTAADAQAVTLPVIVNGRIGAPGDVDVFRIDGHAGDEVVAEVYARRLNSPLDSTLRLTDVAGKQLAFNDDYEDKGSGLNTHHADSYLRVKLPADGAYFVTIADAQQKGGPEYAYRLRLSPPRPDFELRLAPSSLTVRGGISASVTAFALRRDGFAGEIALKLVGAPAGFTLSTDRIPADKDQIQLSVVAKPSPPKEVLSLHLEGRATIGGQTVVRPVVPAEDMMQAFAYRHLVPAQEWMAAVRPGGGGPAGSPNLKAAATLLAKVMAKDAGLPADKTDKFVAAYVTEHQAGLVRLRAAVGDPAKVKAVLADNAQAMLATLSANLTPDQVKKAREVLGTLSGDTDREVAFLMDDKATPEKIEKALPALSKYETAAADEVYLKFFAGQMTRPEAVAKMKELRTAAVKDLAAVLGDDIAAKWAARPALGLGGGGGGAAPAPAPAAAAPAK
jgi:hypothetical protein